MNECTRCHGARRIQVANGGIILIRPCPKCNELNDEKDLRSFSQLESIIKKGEFRHDNNQS